MILNFPISYDYRIVSQLVLHTKLPIATFIQIYDYKAQARTIYVMQLCIIQITFIYKSLYSKNNFDIFLILCNMPPKNDTGKYSYKLIYNMDGTLKIAFFFHDSKSYKKILNNYLSTLPLEDPPNAHAL